MRIILHNPHTDQWFKTTVNYFFTKTKSVNKYEFIFDELYSREKFVYVYIDKTNCLVSGSIISLIRKYLPPIIEFYIWIIINKLSPFRFKIIRNIEKLEYSDVLFSFIISHFTNLSGKFDSSRKDLIDNFKKTKALKVVHLTHYGYNVSIGSKNTKDSEIDLFVSENNLTKNSHFFKHYFFWYKKNVYNLPFIAKKRFENLNDFKNRKNKAIATGTLTAPMPDSDFKYFFKSDQLQPMRLKIYKNSSELKNYLDSFIYKLDEKDNKIKIKNTDSLIKKLFKKIYWGFFSKQKKYFSFNIVEKYNEYKMFIVPEECIDLPGIGFVEGMACGSAFIGKKDLMYEDMGMIDGVHYIGYNGTLANLTEKIKYYQSHQEELENIARNGNQFIKNNLNEKVIFNNFIRFLENELSLRCN